MRDSMFAAEEVGLSLKRLEHIGEAMQTFVDEDAVALKSWN